MNGQRVCNEGEDEAFDNCIMLDEKEVSEETDSYQEKPSETGTREYGSAAMAMASKVTDELSKEEAEIVPEDPK